MSDKCLEIKSFLIFHEREIYDELLEIPTEGLEWLGINVEIDIGEVGCDGTEKFTIGVVCGRPPMSTHRRKERGFRRKEKRFESLNLSLVERWIRDRVRKCDAGSYKESLPCLCRNFDWEYEGIKPDPLQFGDG